MAGEVAIIEQGLGTLANVFGQIQANKAQKKLDAYNDQRSRDISTALKTSQNSNYLDSEAAKGFLNILNKNMKDSSKAVANTSIQGGATPEAVIATEGKLQDRYQNALNNLLNVGQSMKDRDRLFYESQKSHMDDIKTGGLAGKVQQWQQFGQNANWANSNILNAWASGSFSKQGPSGGNITPGDSSNDDWEDVMK